MEEIIDKYLMDLVKNGLNSYPGQIEPEMEVINQNKNDSWSAWLPIDSKAKDAEIIELECRIGYKFPKSYKLFLKHKHFYELFVGECEFCKHPVNNWRACLSEMILDGYPKELLIDKGRIPFANWSDWGLLCFDTTKGVLDNDYPIVLWDHDVSHIFKPMFENFKTMMIELDKIETDQST